MSKLISQRIKSTTPRMKSGLFFGCFIASIVTCSVAALITEWSSIPVAQRLIPEWSLPFVIVVWFIIAFLLGYFWLGFYD
jgi:urea transporter